MISVRRKYTFNTGAVMYHLGISMSHPNVISGGDPSRIRKVAQYLDQGAEIIESKRGLVTVHGTYLGLPVTGFSTGMGPASVSITMPEIIESCDQDDMIIRRIGTAGGLQKRLKIGDIVASTWYERAETTCDKIIGQGYRAETDDNVRKALFAHACLGKRDYQNVYEGPTRTTDDIYFDALDSKGRDHGEVLAVSMEGSVYCALRDRYNRDDNRRIRVGELLVISDSVVAETEHIDATEFLNRQKEIENAHIRAGLETLLYLRR